MPAVGQLVKGATIRFRIDLKLLTIEQSDAYALGCVICDYYVMEDEDHKAAKEYGEHIESEHPGTPHQYERRDYSKVN